MAFVLGFLAGAALGGITGGTVGLGIGWWAGSRYYPPYAPYPQYRFGSPYYTPAFYPSYYSPQPYAWNPGYFY